jgi:hypothetical protein
LSKQKYLAGNVRTFSSKHEIVDADAPLVYRTLPLQIYSMPYGSMVFEQLGYGNLDKRPNVKR